MINVTVLYFGIIREACENRHHDKIAIADGTNVAGLVEQLQNQYPALAAHCKRARMAVNEAIAPISTLLHEGDTVAFIPQVAGGADPYCRLTETPLSVDDVLAAISGPTQGGTVLFVGTVRNHNAGREVTALYYEAYEPMVNRTLRSIIDRCEQSAAGVRVAVTHRSGQLHIGDAAVIVGASAPHRAEAFDAARMCIELLKRETPIWKKEFTPDGAEWVSTGP